MKAALSDLLSPYRLLLAGSGWLALLCVDRVADDAPLRVAAVLLFVLLCPGSAAVRALRPSRGGAAEGFLLALMISLSALVVAATSLMLAGRFSGPHTLIVLAALTTVTALAPVGRAPADPG
jgi:uncharacterized membrane protein